MPIYKIDIDREVISYDRFTRYIRADTEEQARAIGQEMADAANLDCPDDAGPSGCDKEFEDWVVNRVEEREDDGTFEIHNED